MRLVPRAHRSDPPGIALESFVVMSKWRQRCRSFEAGEEVSVQIADRDVRYKRGPPVDSSCSRFPTVRERPTPDPHLLRQAQHSPRTEPQNSRKCLPSTTFGTQKTTSPPSRCGSADVSRSAAQSDHSSWASMANRCDFVAIYKTSFATMGVW